MIAKLFGVVATTLLVVVAATLALWFVLSALTGSTLITFRTGSMAPTMPQGSLAVTVPVKASELKVGDVITVQRVGEEMPVTHRIIAINEVVDRPDNTADIRAAAPGSGAPDLSSPQAREITMQGDDNDYPDQLPYAITDAHRVVIVLPGAGNVLMLLQSPLGLGSMTLLVAALVTWAFWPKASVRPEQSTCSPTTAQPSPSEYAP